MSTLPPPPPPCLYNVLGPSCRRQVFSQQAPRAYQLRCLDCRRSPTGCPTASRRAHLPMGVLQGGRSCCTLAVAGQAPICLASWSTTAHRACSVRERGSVRGAPAVCSAAARPVPLRVRARGPKIAPEPARLLSPAARIYCNAFSRMRARDRWWHRRWCACPNWTLGVTAPRRSPGPLPPTARASRSCKVLLPPSLRTLCVEPYHGGGREGGGGVRGVATQELPRAAQQELRRNT